MKTNPYTFLAFSALLSLPMTAAQAQSVSEADRTAMAENYALADSNGDTMLDLAEFEVLMQLNAEDELGRAAMVVRAGAYVRAFDRLDTNGDGVITQQELRTLVQARG